MKICYVISTVNQAAGANRSLLDMLPFIMEAGHECHVLACAHGTIEEALHKLGVAYHVLPFTTYVKAGSTYKQIKRQAINVIGKRMIRSFFESEHFDLIHNNSLPTAIGIDVANRLRIPYVCHIRENIWDGLGMEFYCPARVKEIIEEADSTIAISEYVNSAYSCFAPDANYSVINDGLVVENYYSKRDIFKSNEVKMGIIGVINPQKGQREAVEAVELVHKRGYSNVSIDIIGDNGLWKGTREYGIQLKEEVRNKGLNYIHFLPAIEDNDELRNKRNEYDINLVCSRAEGLGRITIESMLSGALTIAADAGATKEIVIDGQYGLLYESRNPKDLADKIIYAIEHQDKMKEIAMQSQAYAKEKFSVKAYADKILSIYDTIMRKKDSL